MKNNNNHFLAHILSLVAAVLVFTSCHKEVASVYDQLEGSWTITGVSQSIPQTLVFFWDYVDDEPIMGCDVFGTESPVTPIYGDGDGTYDVIAFEKDHDTIVRFSYEYYDYTEECWVESCTDFIYNSIDPNEMQMTETSHLFSSNNRTFRYIRR